MQNDKISLSIGNLKKLYLLLHWIETKVSKYFAVSDEAVWMLVFPEAKKPFIIM